MNAHLFFTQMISEFHLQKSKLGMSFAALSRRTGISEPTLKRIFSGTHKSAHMDHLLLIAEVLGVDLSLKAINPESLRKRQAEKKAKEIMELVRGNSAMEDQHISKTAYEAMLEKTVIELLSGSNKKLWA